MKRPIRELFCDPWKTRAPDAPEINLLRPFAEPLEVVPEPDPPRIRPRDDSDRFGAGRWPSLAAPRAGALPLQHKPSRWDETGIRRTDRPACAGLAKPRACKLAARQELLPGPNSFLYQKSRPAQRHQKIGLYTGEMFPRNRCAGHENQIDFAGYLVLIPPKRFTEQTPRTRTRHRISNLPARDYPQARGGSGNFNPIQEKATHRQTAALSTRPQEISPASNASLPRESQRSGRRAHEVYVPTGVSRLRPTRRRFFRMARPLFVELRLRNPCWRFRRIFDG